jgi:hypothetical protein
MFPAAVVAILKISPSKFVAANENANLENATCHAVTPPVTNRVTWPLALLKFDHSMRDEMDFVCDANKTLVIRTDLPLSVLLLRSR